MQGRESQGSHGKPRSKNSRLSEAHRLPDSVRKRNCDAGRSGLTQVGIHQVKESSFAQSGTAVTQCQHCLIHIARPTLMGRKKLIVTFPSVKPPSYCRHAPVVKDCCPVVVAGKPFIVASLLPKFLSVINEQRPLDIIAAVTNEGTTLNESPAYAFDPNLTSSWFSRKLSIRSPMPSTVCQHPVSWAPTTRVSLSPQACHRG